MITYRKLIDSDIPVMADVIAKNWGTPALNSDPEAAHNYGIAALDYFMTVSDFHTVAVEDGKPLGLVMASDHWKEPPHPEHLSQMVQDMIKLGSTKAGAADLRCFLEYFRISMEMDKQYQVINCEEEAASWSGAAQRPTATWGQSGDAPVWSGAAQKTTCGYGRAEDAPVWSGAAQRNTCNYGKAENAPIWSGAAQKSGCGYGQQTEPPIWSGASQRNCNWADSRAESLAAADRPMPASARVNEGDKPGELTLFVVAPESRSEGVGTGLFRQALRYLRSRGKKMFYLHSDSFSNHKYYESIGMERIAEQPTNITFGTQSNVTLYLYKAPTNIMEGYELKLKY